MEGDDDHGIRKRTAVTKAKKQQQQQAPAPKAELTPSSSAAVRLITFIFISILVVLASSYIVTDTLTFGYTVPNWRKYIPRRAHIFTLDELAKYNGDDPNLPIYLALLGNVYDVTAGRNYYGKDGGYSFFAGRVSFVLIAQQDATRSYITGCFKTHLTHDLRGLAEGEIKNLQQWVDMYAKSDKYFQVGTVTLPDIDPDSPIPEPCS